MATTKQKQQAGGIAAILAILAGLFVASQQPTPKPPPSSTTTTSRATSTSSTTTTTSPPQVQGVRRFFADTAPINQPASAFGRSPTLQQYATRLWNHGGGAAPAGDINVGFGDYSVPIYNAADATTVARAFQTVWAQKLFTFGTLPIGGSVPWNPTWRAGPGNDELMIIVDDATGRVWELGGVGQLPINCLDWFGPNGQAQFDVGAANHLCLSGANTYTGIHTIDPSTIDGRGSGMAKAALITRADEVASGTIRHALQLTITATMFGPPCRPINDATAVGAGTSCGFYLPPATKLERTNPDTGCPTKQVVSIEERSKTIPEGMRFALDVTDADIEAWLNVRGYTGALRSTARVFAVALRDYGWIVAETGCFGMLIETDSAVVGPAAPKWKQLGITGAAPNPNSDLLDGLLTADRIYVVGAPR